MKKIKPQFLKKDVITFDQKVLRQVSKKTTLEECRDLRLWSRLKNANKTAWTPGSGLATIQIGIPLRFSWLKWEKREFTLLNPEIIEMSEPFIHYPEGCLSIPNVWLHVERYHRIEYITHGELKKTSGFKAVIIQHEVDHMNGILHIDKEPPRIEKEGEEDVI